MDQNFSTIPQRRGQDVGRIADQVVRDGIDSALTEAAADLLYVRQDVGAAWSAGSGSASRSAFVVYAGQVVSNPPTQSEVQAIDDHVKALSQRFKALIDDLRANGVLA